MKGENFYGSFAVVVNCSLADADAIVKYINGLTTAKIIFMTRSIGKLYITHQEPEGIRKVSK